MEATRDQNYELRPYGTRRLQMIEMHLFDDDAPEEKALCGADASDDYIRSAMCYLEDRFRGSDVGAVCEGCKGLAIPFAANLAQDLEAGELLASAAEYREVVETLLRETGRNLPSV